MGRLEIVEAYKLVDLGRLEEKDEGDESF